MHSEVTTDHARKLIRLRLIGAVNCDTLITIIANLMQHPDFREEYDGICDTRDALLELSYEDLIRFRAWLEMQETKLLGRWAILADSNLNFGTGRMWEGLSAGYYKGLQVFKNERDACDWLNSPL